MKNKSKKKWFVGSRRQSIKRRPSKLVVVLFCFCLFAAAVNLIDYYFDPPIVVVIVGALCFLIGMLGLTIFGYKSNRKEGFGIFRSLGKTTKVMFKLFLDLFS